MPIELPQLDDRHFQDLVDDARRLIPHYCPSWTDHNLSDPGITLIELFATLVDTLIHRLNRVPEKSYIAFLNLMGVKLESPSPARADISFWLSRALSGASGGSVLIPAGTEVAIDESGSDKQPFSFSTDANLEVWSPRAITCRISSDEQHFEDRSIYLRENDKALPVFQEKPQAGDSLYIGLENDLSLHILGVIFKGPMTGAGVRPDDPPLIWEVWCGDRWSEAECERDSTGGLNREGQVELHLPSGMAARVIGAGPECYWLRCRHTPLREGQPGYDESPQIGTIRVETLGGTAQAIHAATIPGEILGRSDGAPGQRFRLEYAPVLELHQDETVEVQLPDGNTERWEIVEHFGHSGETSKHFAIDYASGEISFGPLIREPDGRERQYGAIPPEQSRLRFTRYRSGGGAKGNVGAGTLTTLKSSLLYVKEVKNRRSAYGGFDAESLERAKFRAPQMLRTRSRAVTAEDFEHLATSVPEHKVKRAKCLQPGQLGAVGRPQPGAIRLLLVPVVEPASRVDVATLTLASRPALVDAVRKHLDKHRLLTVELKIEQPTYLEVGVTARIKARPEADVAAVEQEAEARLHRFLNPLVGGGNGGQGWPFGRSLYISEVYALLHNVPGVEFVVRVTMQLAGDAETKEEITVLDDQLIVSGRHTVAVV